LAPGTQQEDWWQPLVASVVPDWLGLFAGLEAAASRIRCFEPELVHGLVQTPEYARAVAGADPRLPPEVIDQRVRFRMERQHTEADVILIMGEGALLLVADSAEVMAAQVEHLRRARATIYVLPFSAGAYPRRGSFALLDFSDTETHRLRMSRDRRARSTTTSLTSELNTSMSGRS
jgi:hypothetical protein